MKEKIWQFVRSFLSWFLLFYAVMWGYEKFFMEKSAENPATQTPTITIEAADSSVIIGNLPNFQITNNGSGVVTFTSPCETPDSLEVFRVVNGKRVSVSDFSDCETSSLPNFSLSTGDEVSLNLRNFSAEIFSEPGDYFVAMRLKDTETDELLTVESDQVEFENPGMFRQLFRAVVSKPLFNSLVFLSQNLPGKSFGWAIIILTLLVRLLLFFPNQKAMASQRELQKLQPKIAELREKYKDNQQTLAMKTMELYKVHKVSPMSSCLPMALQLPIMLGVYYIVQEGLSPHLSYLFYSFYEGADLSAVVTQFAGLDLAITPLNTITLETLSSTWQYALLPLIVGGAQFLTIKSSLVAKKNKKSHARGEQAAEKPKKEIEKKPGLSGQMEQMSQTMLWIMPVMIGVFTVMFPAAVGIYWLTSTLFGLAQQKYVNYTLDQPRVRKKVS